MMGKFMKPPKDADATTIKWFEMTKRSQCDRAGLYRLHRRQGFRDDLKMVFRIRLGVPRAGTL